MEATTHKLMDSSIPYLTNGVVDWENDPVSELLIKSGKLKEHELRQIQAVSTVRHDSLGIALTRFGLISEADLAKTLSELTGLNIIPESDFQECDFKPVNISSRFLKSNYVYPLSKENGQLRLAMAEPRDYETIKSISIISGAEVVPQLALCSDIQNAILSLEQDEILKADNLEENVEETLAEQFEFDDMDVAHLRDLASEAPTIRFVNDVLHEAIRLNSSDIHFESNADGLRIRYRIDGVLRLRKSPITANPAAVNSRIKIMAKLDIAERRLPQDGRIQLKVHGKELDIRVSSVPTLFGENIVIRLLDKSNVVLDFESLGFDHEIMQNFEKVLSSPNGIFLVTGPTGCGKTTTLYTALGKLNSIERKLFTVEDPVEYQLEGVNQIAVHPKIGLSFDRVLRSLLRQDPDVIMVGEMRDIETARISIQSALTGHLVLSTLHTNDAVTGITRLLDMGVEEYLVSSTLNGILAQRLIRKLCPVCKDKLDDTNDECIPVGCDECGSSGYKGRIAIAEFMLINDELRDLILNRPDRNSLQAAARKAGMKTLYESGMQLVEKGITSRAEVLKVASEAEDATVSI